MYKLYNVRSWGSLAPHCLLEELGVPYQNIWMTPDQVRAPAYREVHPLGMVPALGLPDGRTIIESAAIMTYLTIAHADKAMAPPPDSLDYAEFLSTLNFMSTNLYPAVSLAISPETYAKDALHQAHIGEVATRQSMTMFELLEGTLTRNGPWLLGETYSALDPYLFMLCLWARPSEGQVLERFPAIARISAGIRARPRLKAVLDAHGVLEMGGYGN